MLLTEMMIGPGDESLILYIAGNSHFSSAPASESCKPTAAAVVGALILKKWPGYSLAGRLAAVNAFLTPTNLCFHKGILSCH